MNIVESYFQEITKICQKYHVLSLAIFGSVLTDRFSDTSDVDFVVNFSDVEIEDYADNYLEMQSSLQNLLGRNVDLIEEKAIRNSVLLNSINNTKQIIYAFT